VGGLNTEASPLTFPENTAKDLDNVELTRDGSIRRRRGVDFETGGSYSSSSFGPELSTYAITSNEWASVDGNDDLNFLVLQIGGELYFHDIGVDAISSGVIGKIDLDPIKISDTFYKDPVSVASGKGKLFVVSPSISPAYLQYNQDTGEFTGVKLTIKIRDTDGIEENSDSPQLFGDSVTNTPTDPTFDVNDITLNIAALIGTSGFAFNFGNLTFSSFEGLAPGTVLF